jgi:hypothetical protein
MLSQGVSMTHINVLRDRGDPRPGVKPRLLQAVAPAAPRTQSLPGLRRCVELVGTHGLNSRRHEWPDVTAHTLVTTGPFPGRSVPSRPWSDPAAVLPARPSSPEPIALEGRPGRPIQQRERSSFCTGFCRQSGPQNAAGCFHTGTQGLSGSWPTMRYRPHLPELP